MGTVVFPLIHARQYGMVIAPPIFSFLSIVAVALRFTARRLAHRRPDASDFTLLVALVLSVAYSGLNMAECIIGGGGLHVSEIFTEVPAKSLDALDRGLDPQASTSTHFLWVLTPAQVIKTFGRDLRTYGGSMVTFQKIGLAVQVLWSTTVTFVKISILLLYCKIFTLPWFIWSARIIGLACIGYTLGTILAAFLVCQPLPYYWDTTIAGGRCGDEFLSYILTGSINIATDVMVLLLPIPSLMGLEMSLSRKMTLVATFACGLFTCIVGALRLQEIVTVDFDDYTYSIANAMTYSALEPALAIVLACVPTLRPLLPSRTRKSDSPGAATSGTSLKWKFHPSLITFGGSAKPETKPRNMARLNGVIHPDDHLETGSECELTIRPAGNAYHVEATSHNNERQRSEETIISNAETCTDARDIEMGIWVEHDWKVDNVQPPSLKF